MSSTTVLIHSPPEVVQRAVDPDEHLVEVSAVAGRRHCICTRRALKHRRGEGEIPIIDHDGRGWWDPLSPVKGDVFSLVQHFDPSLNFGQVLQVLRRFVGLSPAPCGRTFGRFHDPSLRRLS
jgi:hypothetical protein